MRSSNRDQGWNHYPVAADPLRGVSKVVWVCASKLRRVVLGADELSAIEVSVPDSVVEEIIDAVTQRVLDALALKEQADHWPKWMSVDTAARYLDVSPERVRKLVARRELPFHQEGRGCRVLFSRSDLDDWMADFRQPGRGQGPQW